MVYPFYQYFGHLAHLLPLDKHLLGILLAAALALIVGLVDDVKDISPKFRLFTNFLSALIVVASGIGIAYVSNPFGGIIDLSQPQIHFNFSVLTVFGSWLILWLSFGLCGA